MDAFTTLVGTEVAQRIFTLLHPTYTGRYNSKLGGMYTGTIELPDARNKALSLLDTIYPKACDGSARIWRSINHETNKIWVGVTRSTPRQDRLQHTNAFALDRAKKERMARTLRAVAAAGARSNTLANSAAKSSTMSWGSFATVESGRVAAKQKANTSEAIKQRVAEMQAKKHLVPDRTFTEIFKLTKAKTQPVEEDVPTRGDRLSTCIPPHVRALLAKEAAAAPAAAATG